jgi:hypothetical protein
MKKQPYAIGIHDPDPKFALVVLTIDGEEIAKFRTSNPAAWQRMVDDANAGARGEDGPESAPMSAENSVNKGDS